jgi:hypothetical protein
LEEGERMSARVLPHRRGWSSGDAAPKQPKVWTPVAVPTRPNYDGIEEKRRWEAALASTPREPGEELHEHMARVAAKAKGATVDEREPGQEG